MANTNQTPCGVDLTPLNWPCKLICWQCGEKMTAEKQIELDVAREYGCPECGATMYALRRIFKKKATDN